MLFHQGTSLFGLFLSHILLPFGASVYAAVVVSRFNRFYNAKDMAFSVLFCLEPVVNKESLLLHRPWPSARLALPVQILRDSGQLDAHYVLLNIAKDIERELTEAEARLRAGAAEVPISKDQWETEARIMQPSMQAILSPRPYRF